MNTDGAATANGEGSARGGAVKETAMVIKATTFKCMSCGETFATERGMRIHRALSRCGKLNAGGQRPAPTPRAGLLHPLAAKLRCPKCGRECDPRGFGRHVAACNGAGVEAAQADGVDRVDPAGAAVGGQGLSGTLAEMERVLVERLGVTRQVCASLMRAAEALSQAAEKMLRNLGQREGATT